MGKAAELVAQMTLEEKASLCSGADFWHSKSVERLGLAPVMVADGPHGLRKQLANSDNLGFNESVPATCFPPACTTACSFDRALLEEIGRAMGEECQQEEVAVILGPGANIKRSPLCGRNFEYFSEDPFLTGEMAAAIICGIQKEGVGASLKHYAANNQESYRLVSNSVVDERALREIYLQGFETAVKKTQPWTVMSSYNLVNGSYVGDSELLLTRILREEWGFEGLVMSDWGATNDRVQGVRAGLDLEMPSSGGVNDEKIMQAVRQGALSEDALDRVAVRVTELILKAHGAQKQKFRYDAEKHHDLARRAAAASAVLLKNEENILPLRQGKNAAVIGAFAKTPRYQGTGSSKINPSRMDNAHDELEKAGLPFEYAPGYSLEKGAQPDEKLLEEARRVAKGKEVALVFAGLPDEYESEGFDRTGLAMPAAHLRLIEAVAEVNPNTVVLLLCGAPVLLPFADKVKGILLLYLGGQGGGEGCARLLMGKECPGGKLAESFPLSLSDVPCGAYFPGGSKSVEYRESIFVGYRYYDTAAKEVRYPFGYGLSYTTFSYSGLSVEAPVPFAPGDTVKVKCRVTNTGEVAGAETVQVYVGMENSRIYRAAKELKGFEKVFLQPGESRQIEIPLEPRGFSYYNVPAGGFAMEGGQYTISVGSSSRDIRLQAGIKAVGDGKEELLSGFAQKAPTYYHLPKGPLLVPAEEFTVLYGRPLPPGERLAGEAFTANSTLRDMQGTFTGKLLRWLIMKVGGRMLGKDNGDTKTMLEAMMMDFPLRSAVMLTQGAVTQKQVDGVITMANGGFWGGLWAVLRGGRKKKKA